MAEINGFNFLVNKLEAELPIGTRKVICRNYNHLFINVFAVLK